MKGVRGGSEIGVYLPVLLCFLYLLNYVVQSSVFAGVYHHIFNVLYISLLIFLMLNKKIDIFFVLVLFYFVVCHQYASDPYNESFKNYISGFYKFIVLSLLLPFIKVSRLHNVLFALILLVATIYSILWGQWFRGQYFLNDFLICAFFLLFLMGAKVRPFKELDAANLIFRFSLTLPVVCLAVYLMGLHSELYGSYYFFYGQTYSLVVLFSAAYFFEKKYSFFSFGALFTLINIVIFIQSAQTAQLLIVLLAVIIVTLFRRRLKDLFLLVVLLISFFVLAYTAESGSWLYLKLNQLVSLLEVFSGDLDRLMSFNSIAVRLAQLQSILLTSDWFELLFGRGLGSIYTDELSLISQLNLHEASFPVAELSSGEFYRVHESWVFLIMKAGVSGFLLVCAYFVLRIYKAHSNYSILILYLFVFMFWSSSLQFILFSFVLKLLMDEGKTRV